MTFAARWAYSMGISRSQKGSGRSEGSRVGRQQTAVPAQAHFHGFRRSMATALLSRVL